MANPLLQKSRQRKMIYIGVIIALLSISLAHREFVLKPQAEKLQLRETVLGEVELTSSAVRLMLTGSRGLAVTLLWYNAIEKQKRNEWNELELLVKSITKLQPYFITPWLYQSWNISFNVAVECDRPRDKYYYISRGLELLAEGERRNSGTAQKGAVDDPDRIVIPGNPELRHFMGFTYQLKIGNSDEQQTMRSLLEMSCIDPIQRDPQRFAGERGQVNLIEFAKFAETYPRLVRRLNEQLGYEKPERIVKFLEDHQNIPSRFKPIDKAQQGSIKESERKHPYDQFPILPPKEGRSPDPLSRELTNEAIDVFLVCRTWYEYAQKPLPPEEEEPQGTPRDYDKLRYRVPKQMMIQLFRQYPARAQVYIAEMLEGEGFFDDSGWNMQDNFKKWYFDKKAHIYGTHEKYHSRRAWAEGYRLFKLFGEKNGMYIAPARERELDVLAADFRAFAKEKPGAIVPLKQAWREGAMRKSYDAHTKLAFNKFYRNLANFDSFLYQSEGEMDEITATLRKTLFLVQRELKHKPPDPVTLAKYEEAWQLYLHAAFKYPRFAQVDTMQEDFCETYQKYLGNRISVHMKVFKSPPLVAAIGFMPAPGSLEAITLGYVVGEKSFDEQEMVNVWQFRLRYGPIDTVQFYAGHDARELKEFIFSLLQGASLAQNPTCASLFPGCENFMLIRAAPFLSEEPLPNDWKPMIAPHNRATVRDRLGLNR
jgi:hypothetical protein